MFQDYAMKCKLSKLGHLPPRIATHLFSAVVEPILTYGTEVWGVNQKGTEQIDKLYGISSQFWA